MKTIGLIGGISSQSSAQYYNLINQTINERLGGHHAAKLVMVSLNSHDVMTAMHENNWETVTKLIMQAAQQLVSAQADFIGICCNSAHKIFDNIKKVINVPLVHILDPIIVEIKKLQLQTVGILGTQFIMRDGFYQDYLAQHDINAITPKEKSQDMIHTIIFNELCHGRIIEESKRKLLEIVESLRQQGAEGIILGCTELPLILKEQDLPIPLFSSTTLHAKALAHCSLYDHI